MDNASEKRGFRLPEGYFKDFPDRVMARMKPESSQNIESQGGFKVPDGYFEGLADRIQERMPGDEPKVRTLWVSRIGWVAAAAAAILLLVLMPDRQVAGVEFEDLSGESIASYLETRDGDLSAQELAEGLPLNEIAFEDFTGASLDAQHIAEYLENDTEVEDEFYWNDDE